MWYDVMWCNVMYVYIYIYIICIMFDIMYHIHYIYIYIYMYIYIRINLGGIVVVSGWCPGSGPVLIISWLGPAGYLVVFVTSRWFLGGAVARVLQRQSNIWWNCAIGVLGLYAGLISFKRCIYIYIFINHQSINQSIKLSLYLSIYRSIYLSYRI